jgi:predicted  nucleic acid-binding Zn-ribbon protein
LDKELILRQFDEIEQKVEKLIGTCKSHEETISDLRNRIKGLEEELQAKTEAETHFTEERALIRSKIDTILGRLEDISEA